MSLDTESKKLCPVCRKVYPGTWPQSCCDNDGAPLEPFNEPKLSAIFLDKYRIVGEIGRGGWGTVYEVEHVSLGKRFAVKVLSAQIALNPQAVERFAREAKALSLI